jgi:DNA-binding NarL/FixJ family response regulator
MANENKISIIIADDHPVFRAGVRHIIESGSNMQVIGEAGDGIEAVELIENLNPNVAVLDIDMPKCNGIQTARTLRERNISVAIIILTMYSEEDFFNEVMELGVKGFVLKDNATNDILNAIKTVAEGKHYITPILSGYLIRRNEKNQTANKILKNITAMERRVLSLIAENKTSKEIAEELFISHKTVENHRSNICAKLNLHGSNALLKFAIENRAHIIKNNFHSCNF